MSELWPFVPYGLYLGTRAITQQNYVEANVKNGVQFESSSGHVVLAAGANHDVVFITGDKPVIIKGRIMKFNGVLLSTRIYRAPTYTGGTPAAVYNLNDIDPVASTVQLLFGATVTDAGTEFGAPTFELGSSGLGNEQTSVYSFSGIERVLRPNTAYLQRTTNLDGVNQTIVGSLTWYEGTPDFPR